MKITNVGISFIFFFVHFHFIALSQETSGQPRLNIPFGHQLGIRESHFSSNNELLITTDESMTIMWDVRSGKNLYTLNGTYAVINASDQLIATAMDTLIMIWSAGSGGLMRSLVLPAEVTRLEFSPVNDWLLIEMVPQGEKEGNNNGYRHVALWNTQSTTLQHTFKEPVGSNKKEKCATCTGGNCMPYGGWFTNKGDSIRVVFDGLLQTYASNNYQTARNTCLTKPEMAGNPSSVKVLDGHVVKMQDEQSAWCFNENGTLLGMWPVSRSQATSIYNVQECISPAYNYHAIYNSNRVYLNNIDKKTSRQYAVKKGQVKKLTFNEAGTHVLVEYLNEPPRLLLAESFSEPVTLSKDDYKGLPTYVLETKTDPEAGIFNNMFDSVSVKLPKSMKLVKKAFGVDVNAMVQNVYTEMNNDLLRSFTNSGEVYNLAANHPVSKIQSLIKLSGDIKMSPDGKYMLLNTGKILSLYSIPDATILMNLRAMYQANVFSPDSRYLVQFCAGVRANIIDLVNNKIDSVPLKLPVTAYCNIVFTPDNKKAILNVLEGGYAILDLDTRKIDRQVPEENLFVSADGSRYSVINQKKHIIRIYNSKDSSLVADLPVKAGNNQQRMAYGEGYNMQFAGRSNGVAVWGHGKLMYVPDLARPADTIPFGNIELTSVSRISISPNGQYLAIEGGGGDGGAVIVNTQDPKKNFDAVIHQQADMEGMSFRMGAMMRDAMGGYLAGILGSREMVQFSSTGDSVWVSEGDSIAVFACASGQKLYGAKVPGEIKYYKATGNLLLGYYYGQLKMYRLNNRKEWFSMIPFKNGETVFLLPEGIYKGSKAAARQLSYVYDAKALSYKQFDYNNNRPDKVLRALGNTDVKKLAIYDSTLAMRRRREGLRDVSIDNDRAPLLSITNIKAIEGDVTQPELPLQLQITRTTRPLDSLALYVNGNPMGGPKGIKLSRGKTTIDTTVKVILTPGPNTIEVSVFDTDRQESYRQPLYVHFKDTSMVGKVYFAGIAAAKYQKGKSLTYAIKDIMDVHDSLKKQYGSRLIVDTLFNSQVTREKVLALRSRYEQTKPEDIVIVYYSGHGCLTPKMSEAFFATYDMNFEDASKRGLSLGHFNGLLDYIPARNKVIFLDACHSGEVRQDLKNAKMLGYNEIDPFDLVLELYTDHYQGNGTNIVVAAHGLEKAKECESLGHGVFTSTVISGLSQMTADADSNAVLTITELHNYVTSNMYFFSAQCEASKVQRAAVRKENEYNDWAVLYSGKNAYGAKAGLYQVQDEISWSEKYQKVTRVLSTVNSLRQKPTLGGLKGLWQAGKEELQKKRSKKNDGTAWLEAYQKNAHPAAKPLIEDKSFPYTVKWEIVKIKKDEFIVFDINCIDMLPVIRIDMDHNNLVDACTDKEYKAGDDGEIYAGYLSSGGCSALKTEAVIYSAGTQHLFRIPLSEITGSKGKGKVNLRFYKPQQNDPVTFPVVTDQNALEKTVEIL